MGRWYPPSQWGIYHITGQVSIIDMVKPATIYENRPAAEGVAGGKKIPEFPAVGDYGEKAKTWRTIIAARYDEQENTLINRIGRY
jgi:hypothetical protein